MTKLFDPVRVGPYALSHRVVLAPMTRLRAEQPGDRPGELMAEFYGQRATQDGLLIAESTPVARNGKVYFCSDDGHLYCVEGKTGELVWKFRGAPGKQKVLGNRRVISMWPARGGPVLWGDHLYFASSIWPFMGTFIYSLDADTGEVEWVNDSTGANYIKQPHSAPSFGGVAPQGALVATPGDLIVPGGRSVPAVFDRKTKWKFAEATEPLHGEWQSNYPSLREHAAIVHKQLFQEEGRRD